MKKYPFLFAVSALFLFVPSLSSAATLFSQSVTLSPGWNIVSTPRLLDSHNFSTAETSANFDIYVLDAAQPSQWATMAAEGQSEFTPLAGYFINNKTGTNQTLTFNYLASTTPNQQLFSKTFTIPGWYSIGVANPTYALPVGSAALVDTNNPAKILNALTGFYDNAVDFTDGNFNSNPDSPAVASAWKAVVLSDINALNDFRETKAYAIHTSQSNAPYDGFQNSNGAPPPINGTVVSAGTQPANSVAPVNAQRVPFTAFTIIANGGAVNLVNITVQRQGPSTSSDFSGVELIDPTTGLQLGTSSALDSNGNATIGTSTIIAAGTSKTFWVAANISPTAGSGDVASFAVTSINTPSTISGTLPIVGASNTLNASLTIGSASVQTSSLDPNSVSTQPIGTTDHRFTAIRVAAGSAEDLSLKSITWYQSGSTTGLTNVVTVVNSTPYPTTADATGHYYTTVFPSAITIAKSSSVDVYVQADISASAVVNTSTEFDVYRNSDIYLVGNTYGYGILSTISSLGTISTAASHGSNFAASNTGNPFFQGSTVAIIAAPAGSLAASVDPSAPSYTLVAGGTSGVLANVIKLRATNEPVNLQKIGLTLTNSASSSASDIAPPPAVVSLYAGNNIVTTSGTSVAPGTLIGTASFTGTATTSTSTLSTAIQLPHDIDATIVVKADIAPIGTNAAGTEGHLLAVDFVNAQGTGNNSSQQINTPSLTGPGVAGLRMYHTIPTTVSLDPSLGSTGIAGGTLMEFYITADGHGQIGLDKLTFNIASTAAVTVTNVQLFAYTNSGYSSPVSGNFGTAIGQFGATTAKVTSGTNFSISATTNPMQIAAGATVYFKLIASVAGVGSGSSVTTKLIGDSAYIPTASPYFVGSTTGTVALSNFVWSPNATTTATIGSTADWDWVNSYGVLNFPAIGLIKSISQ